MTYTRDARLGRYRDEVGRFVSDTRVRRAELFSQRLRQSQREWHGLRVHPEAHDWLQGGRAHGPAAWSTVTTCAPIACQQCRRLLPVGELVLVRWGTDPPATRELLCRDCGLATGLLLECAS